MLDILTVGSSTSKPSSSVTSSGSHSSHSSDVVMGPGGPGDRISTPYEHAVGVERLEYLAKMSGKNLWLMDPLKVDHYGTLDDPIIVESMAGERIAGCTGFPKWSHEVVWMKVSGVKRCPECGQAFKIKKVE